MIVTYKIDNNIITFYFTIEEDDIGEVDGYSLSRNSFRLVLPFFITQIGDLHPDKWALILILVLFNHIGNSLFLPFTVSETFHQFFLKCGKQILPFSKNVIAPISDRHSVKDAICYSCGINSTLLSTVMGQVNTVLVHMGCLDFNGIEKSIDRDYQYNVMDLMTENNYQLYEVLTDIPSLFIDRTTNKIELPDSMLYGIGVVLLSDYLSIHTINYGFTLTDVLSLGKQHFKKMSIGGDSPRRKQIYLNDYENYSDSISFWKKIFDLVDLSLQFPIMCITPIVSLLAIQKTTLKGVLNGCLNRFSKNACGSCEKCLFEKIISTHQKSESLETHIFNNVCAEFNKRNYPIVCNIYENSLWNLFWLYYLPKSNTSIELSDLEDLYDKKKWLTEINESALHIFFVNEFIYERIQEIVRMAK